MKDSRGLNFEILPTDAKIISLVPSITELLVDMGLEENIVGVTKFCVHPAHLRKTKPRIGGTKNVNIESLLSLKPDLVLANIEENIKEQVEEISKSIPTFTTDVFDFDSALKMIDDIGKLTQKEKESQEIVIKIQEAKATFTPRKKIKVLYLIWEKPFMGAGGDTFINSMLEEAGFENVLKNSLRYPSLEIEEIKNLNADYIFLSSEPFPFKLKHSIYYQSFFPESRVVCVDGEMYSWYGSRMIECFKYFRDFHQKYLY